MAGRIVVGFDGSAGATAGLAWAAEEARLRGWRLVAITVIDEHPPPPGIDATIPDMEGTLGTLQEKAAAATNGHPVTLEQRRGGAAAELIAACDAADILVVGSRGRNPLAGLLLGSVSKACLAHAPCPVVVARHPAPAERIRRVIVGVDGSEAARNALRVAAEEARLRDAALHAVHAVYWDHLGAELITPTPQQLVEWGKNLVDKELERAGVAARPVVIHGHAADVLVRHSGHADLLVLGSRGHNPLATLLLGSTTDHCARHAACPVMAVPLSATVAQH